MLSLMILRDTLGVPSTECAATLESEVMRDTSGYDDDARKWNKSKWRENINNTRRTHSVTIQGQQKREIKKQYDNRKDERGY